MNLYTSEDKKRRLSDEIRPKGYVEYRTEWRRDYARLVHSPAFRRLQGKMQLFPGIESDFFRNRLTHSIEVAQIAKSIALKLNYDFEKRKESSRIETDIVEFAGLAHDLGHPPFGHVGERALNEIMKGGVEDGGDVGYGGFEGNAQTLRILAKLEKKFEQGDTIYGIDDENQKDKRVGLNLTYRTLASILKKDQKITYPNDKELVKGYYESEEDLVKEIKNNVAPEYKGDNFKTIECQIMDFADDIAYSVFDFEDALKAHFLSPARMLSMDNSLLTEIATRVNDALRKAYPQKNIKKLVNDDITGIFLNLINELSRVFLAYKKEKVGTPIHSGKTYDTLKNILHASEFMMSYRASSEVTRNGYLRTDLTSQLVDRFINSISCPKIDPKHPALSIVTMGEEEFIEMEILKQFSYVSEVKSSKIKIVEYRGKQIINKIFECLRGLTGYEMLPEDYRDIYQAFSTNSTNKSGEKREINKEQMRTICDFIAGMTDQYAAEFYSKLYSENPQTIFKSM